MAQRATLFEASLKTSRFETVVHLVKDESRIRWVEPAEEAKLLAPAPKIPLSC